MMNVGILSDTHIPDRENELPAPFRERIAAADHVVHAGDVTGSTALADLRELAAELTAVRGNVTAADSELPFYDAVTVGGVTFVVTHCHVGVRTREDWLRTVADAATQYGQERSSASAAIRTPSRTSASSCTRTSTSRARPSGW